MSSFPLVAVRTVDWPLLLLETTVTVGSSANLDWARSLGLESLDSLVSSLTEFSDFETDFGDFWDRSRPSMSKGVVTF